MSDERRTLEEQVGVSLNASSLRISASDPSAETSLQRVAALGAAVLQLSYPKRESATGVDHTTGHTSGPLGVEAADQTNTRPTAKAIDRVAGELGAALYHLRFGGQLDQVKQAVALFSTYIAMRQRFSDGGFLAPLAPAARADLIRRFAERALHEWLSDRCVACAGCGRLERTQSGSWIRPRGNMKRNAVYRPCQKCHGSGRALPSHTQRRQALGIGLAQYEKQAWQQHFQASMTWLSSITGRLKGPLTRQLERSKKRE